MLCLYYIKIVNSEKKYASASYFYYVEQKIDDYIFHISVDYVIP